MTFIIPYRDRQRHLSIFIPHYKSLFPEAKFIIIQQYDAFPFNRGKLLNVGFIESDKDDYYIFHDVDMISVEKPDYSKPKKPVHCATKCEQFGYKMPFKDYFGGVNIFTKQDFEKCEGFSNLFWGYGAEDEEMFDNVMSKIGKIERREIIYRSLSHSRLIDPILHKKNIKYHHSGRVKNDGINYCKYKMVEKIKTQENVFIVKVDL